MARNKSEPNLPPWRSCEFPITIRSLDVEKATPPTSKSNVATTKWRRRRRRGRTPPTEEAPSSWLPPAVLAFFTKWRRRRGRGRTPSKEEAPPPWLPPAVLAFLVLSLSLSNFASEHLAAPRVVDAGRRALLLDGEMFVADSEEENVWRRRLRERKDRRRMQRSMAAEVEEEDGIDNYDSDLGRARSLAVVMEQEETWPAYEGKHRFEECVDKTVSQCQALIDVYVAEHPEQFNGRTTLYLDVHKIRELTDESYYKVVLPTDMEAEFVAGIFGDGRVYYPWPWTVYGEDLAVGPWDCAGLTPEECCQDIQEDVNDPNDAGDFMACFVEEPVGTKLNPERDDRAIAVVDADLCVVKAPIVH